MGLFESRGAVFDPDDAALYETYERGIKPRDRAISGAELRRRLITPEVIAAIEEEEPKKSLLQRMLRR